MFGQNPASNNTCRDMRTHTHTHTHTSMPVFDPLCSCNFRTCGASWQQRAMQPMQSFLRSHHRKPSVWAACSCSVGHLRCLEFVACTVVGSPESADHHLAPRCLKVNRCHQLHKYLINLMSVLNTNLCWYKSWVLPWIFGSYSLQNYSITCIAYATCDCMKPVRVPKRCRHGPTSVHLHKFKLGRGLQL